MSTVNNQVSFGATIVPLSKEKNALKLALKSVDSCFEFKGFGSNHTPEQIRERINLSQAAVQTGKDCIKILGGDREADEFIFREVSKAVPEAKYVQDTPKTVFNGPVFELLG